MTGAGGAERIELGLSGRAEIREGTAGNGGDSREHPRNRADPGRLLCVAGGNWIRPSRRNGRRIGAREIDRELPVLFARHDEDALLDRCAPGARVPHGVLPRLEAHRLPIEPIDNPDAVDRNRDIRNVHSLPGRACPRLDDDAGDRGVRLPEPARTVVPDEGGALVPQADEKLGARGERLPIVAQLLALGRAARATLLRAVGRRAVAHGDDGRGEDGGESRPHHGSARIDRPNGVADALTWRVELRDVLRVGRLGGRFVQEIVSGHDRASLLELPHAPSTAEPRNEKNTARAVLVGVSPRGGSRRLRSTSIRLAQAERSEAPARPLRRSTTPLSRGRRGSPRLRMRPRRLHRPGG